MKLRKRVEYRAIWQDGAIWRGDDPAWHAKNCAAMRRPGSPIVRTEIVVYKVLR